jgi:hypothetical protein
MHNKLDQFGDTERYRHGDERSLPQQLTRQLSPFHRCNASVAKAMRTKDEEALQSSDNVYAKEIVDRTMVVPGKSVAEAVELARESGTVIRRKPEDVYDNSFVLNLEKSGFLKEIWGSENYKR